MLMRKVLKELKDALKEKRAGDWRKTPDVGEVHSMLERQALLAPTTEHSTAGRFGTFH